MRRFGNTLDDAGILYREKALGDEDIQRHGQRHGGEKHRHGQGLPLQYPFQAAAVTGNQLVEPVVGLVGFVSACSASGRSSLAHIIGVSVSDTIGGNQDRHRQRDRKFPEQAGRPRRP